MSASMQVLGGLGVFAAGYMAGNTEVEALKVVIKAGALIGGGAAVLGLCKKVKEVAGAVASGIKDYSKDMKEEVQGLKAMLKEQSDQVMEELRDCSRDMKKEVQVLKAQLKGQHDQAIQAMEGIYDRADKCGNKLEMMEFRVEGLVQQFQDTQRHLSQCMCEYRKDKAGDQGIEVFDRWVEDVAQKWLQARGWLRDIKPDKFKNTWVKLWKGAMEYSWAHHDAVKADAARVLKEEQNIAKRDKLEAECEAIKANLEEHLKKSFWWIKEDVQGMWEEEDRMVVWRALNSVKE